VAGTATVRSHAKARSREGTTLPSPLAGEGSGERGYQESEVRNQGSEKHHLTRSCGEEKPPFPKGAPAEGWRGFVEKDSPQRTHRAQKKRSRHSARSHRSLVSVANRDGSVSREGAKPRRNDAPLSPCGRGVQRPDIRGQGSESPHRAQRKKSSFCAKSQNPKNAPGRRFACPGYATDCVSA